jgi:hypothetical protein
MTDPRAQSASDEIPARRENWAEAVSQDGARCVISTRSGHVLVSDEPPGFVGGAGGTNTGPTPTGLLAAAFAADIPVIVRRIAGELAIDVEAIRARVTIAWNPRGIAGAAGISPAPFEAVSEIWLRTGADRPAMARLQAAYESRCPLYALFRNSGCRMTDRWHVESDQSQAREETR